MTGRQTYPMIQAIIAAVLFGASAPLAKLLLGAIEPIPLAAFLYLGSGLGLLVFRVMQITANQTGSVEAPLSKGDFPWLIGAILAGGVGAPIVLMFSLRSTPAATASLLLNFEGVATALLAGLAFREAIGKHVWAAVVCITTASMLLSWNADGEWGFSLGAVGVMGACILWGADNNFTRNISAKDPLAIVTFKGICAGTFSLLLALILHAPFPNVLAAFGAMLLGSLSYGLSVVLFILAMRSLGAARTSAFFGTAPFAGVLLSFLLLKEVPHGLFIVSLPIMIVGAVLLLSEEHEHMHVHTAILHEHRHRHDDNHHAHPHAEEYIPPNLSHTHLHRHGMSAHSHPHMPDIHHRHDH